MREQGQESEEFEVNVGMHQGPVLSPFLFAVVVDVVIELASVINELLYADNLALKSEAIGGLRNEIVKWKALKSKH